MRDEKRADIQKFLEPRRNKMNKKEGELREHRLLDDKLRQISAKLEKGNQCEIKISSNILFTEASL